MKQKKFFLRWYFSCFGANYFVSHAWDSRLSSVVKRFSITRQSNLMKYGTAVWASVFHNKSNAFWLQKWFIFQNILLQFTKKWYKLQKVGLFIWNWYNIRTYYLAVGMYDFCTLFRALYSIMCVCVAKKHKLGMIKRLHFMSRVLMH